MNFIAASIELKENTDQVAVYGNNYVSATGIVANGDGNNEVRFRLLCYDGEGKKLSSFLAWKPNTNALITGELVFSGDMSKPLDLLITTIETNVPQDLYCNQVVMGSAYFAGKEIKERANGTLAVYCGTTMDNSDVKTFFWMESNPSRKTKLDDRFRRGRQVCIQGYLREYRPNNDTDQPYRAIVCQNFTTRKDREKTAGATPKTGSATGYGADDLDPTPDYNKDY